MVANAAETAEIRIFHVHSSQLNSPAVARELELADGMRERLRRALDRVDCAQGVLEAVREIAGSEGAWKDLPAGSCGRGVPNGEPTGDYENDASIEAMGHAWDAMESLAGEWPQDYPEGAVEWLALNGLKRAGM